MQFINCKWFLLQTGSDCDYNGLDVWGSEGNSSVLCIIFACSFVLVPWTLEIYALIFNCKTKYVCFFGCLLGYMCCNSHGKRRDFEESIQRVDFDWIVNCIGTSSSYLCFAKQFVADILQESWFADILHAEPDKNILHCFVYVYYTEVSAKCPSLFIGFEPTELPK